MNFVAAERRDRPGPRRWIERLSSWCFSILLASIALYCAVKVLEAIWPALAHDRRNCGNYRPNYSHRCLFHITKFVVKMAASTSIDRELEMLRTYTISIDY